MFLTIYYIAATFIQSWRIRNIYNKINSKLLEKCSVVFYNLSKEGDEANTTSELCVNHSQARISDILWLKDNQRGCSIIPQQVIHLGPWVTFPLSPNLIPFEFYNYHKVIDTNVDNKANDENNDNGVDYAANYGVYNDEEDDMFELNLNSEEKIHLLLETDTIPLPETNDIIMIEKYGKPLAWKVDSHFAVILESDIMHFTKLIMSTFMQNNFSINDRLPLIRIESINCDGKPQPFDLLKNHLRKQLISRAMRHLSMNEWEKHLSGLRSLSILASQAIEFEYNKNRTEGKVGVVKPDLIPLSSSSMKNNADGTNTSKSPTKTIEIVVTMKTSSPSKQQQQLTDEKSLEKEKVEKSLPSTSKSTIKKDQTSPISNLTVKTSKNEDSISNVKPVSQSPALPSSSTTITSTNETQKSPNKSTPTENQDNATTVSVKSKESRTLSSVKNVTDEKQPIIPRPIPKASDIATSSNRNNAKRPSLVRNKGSLISCKPPNVLVYSDSISIRDSVIATLKNILERDMYTIYSLTPQQVKQKVWIDNTSLLIVCGPVESDNSEILVDYFLLGGKMLSLCSDLLHIIIPTYRTAEVRENELVQFSYDKWQKIKMMHHIFCYHPSPVKKHFSTEAEESVPTLTKKPAIVCPRSVEVKDLQGDMHNLDVKVLGIEETWNTPSLLLANNVKSGGKAVFSQIHLEADPTQFENDEIKFSILKQNDKARLEILSDLLKTHLDMPVQKLSDDKKTKYHYKNGYFLGHHELKFELVEKLKSRMENENLIKLKNNNLSIKFYGKNEQPSAATKEFLPILILSCPEDFSTVHYFDNLKTKSIGRLVFYIPVIGSTMYIVNELSLTHGTAVIARQQTNGVGRNSNQWLSPDGCAMFSLQLHIPINSILGQKLSLMQHLIAISMVKAVIDKPDYENLDIRLKWPNDIYANGVTKIGGLIINSQIQQNIAICNIGCGINLNNSNPTLSINNLIKDYNRLNNKNLQLFGYEKLIALIFTEIENLLESIQNDDLALLYELYYKYWLHNEQEVLIIDKNGHKRSAKIIGIDDYGFLQVQIINGKIESVHPDGNTFDMLRGLITPK